VSELTSENFRACLHTSFAVRDPAPGVGLELIAVNIANFSPKLDNFSLIFRGPKSPFLEQRIYPMAHERFGDFELFLVPIGPDSLGMRYEAVFNRVLQASK
jgi:hypothetical protein